LTVAGPPFSGASLVFSRSWNRLLDLPIRAWEGDDCSHVGVRLGDKVIDATLLHGVAATSYEEWCARRELMQEIDIFPASFGAAEQASNELHAKVGLPYDWRGVLGFPLLRDLDQRNAWWCSELAAHWLTVHAGIVLPGRPGRRGVRLLRWVASGYSQRGGL
jgi:hypothetical protein